MNRNGSILAVGISVGIFVWLITHLYVNLYTQEQSVFPLDEKNAEILELGKSDILAQSFRVSHEDLNEIRMLVPIENQAFEVMIVRIEGGAEPLIAEITSEQIVNSPQVVIGVPDSFDQGEVVIIRVGVFAEEEGEWSMWAQDNKYMSNPKVKGQMWVNGMVSNKNLVFRPIYGDKDSLVAGDVMDMKFEVKMMILNLLEGRPAWVQWTMMISSLLTVFLNGGFIYYGYIIATKSLTKDQENQVLLIIGITFVAGLIIW